jgi:Ca2+-transporting ATPase
VLYNFNADGTLTPYEQSWFFTFFVMLQFWNMFNAKAFMTGRSALRGLSQSSSFIFVALIIIIGQYLIVTFGGEMFNVTPLSLHSWIVIMAITSPVLLIGEIIRLFKK